MANEVFSKVVALVTGQELNDLSQAGYDAGRSQNTKQMAEIHKASEKLIANMPRMDSFTQDEYEYMRTAFREGVPYWAYQRIKALEERVNQLERD